MTSLGPGLAMTVDEVADWARRGGLFRIMGIDVVDDEGRSCAARLMLIIDTYVPYYLLDFGDVEIEIRGPSELIPVVPCRCGRGCPPPPVGDGDA